VGANRCKSPVFSGILRSPTDPQRIAGLCHVMPEHEASVAAAVPVLSFRHIQNGGSIPGTGFAIEDFQPVHVKRAIENGRRNRVRHVFDT